MTRKRMVLSARGDGTAIPKPNLNLTPQNGQPLEGEVLRAMFCNPIYAGIHPFPPMVSDEQWIRAALKEIEAEGAAQFLANMLHVLRETMRATQ